MAVRCLKSLTLIGRERYVSVDETKSKCKVMERIVLKI